jgi:GAF domain-containing protein/biotin carboxyl carrier protein
VTDRETRLQQELQRAYDTLTDVTTRLLLAGEAAEIALAGTDRQEISEKFLAIAARGVTARRAALFLLEGGYSVGATFGLDDAAEEALAESDVEPEVCDAAVQGSAPHVVDAALVDDDVLPASVGEAAADDAEAEGDDEEDGDGGEEAEEEEAEEAEEEEAPGGPEDGPSDDEEAPSNRRPLFGIYLPVHVDDEPAAVLALGERLGGRPYRNDELIFLQYLLRQFALTLHRSMLLEQNQERLAELGALLRVSREITSTLDLDAVLRGVVNTVASVVENDRAEIALLRAGRLGLRAVSGLTRLDPDQAELFKLARPLEYLRLHPGRFQIGAEDLAADPPPPGHGVFQEYFSAQEMRSFMALPLQDEQGLLGYLCLESRQDTWSIEPAEGDSLSILAAQTSVAIRNATLYSEIPLRGMSLPVAQLRGRLRALSPRGRTMALAGTLVVVAGLLLPIFPERAGGGAEVRPLLVQGARAMSEGVVSMVLVADGAEVRRGQSLAIVEDLDLAERIADLRSQIETARRDLAVARRATDVPTWRANEVRLAALERTLEVEERHERASELRAPLSGQVLELVGQHLEAGESFCTVAALHRMAADFDVAEEKIGRVRVGQRVSIKVMSFPTHTFRGRVIEVGWRGQPGAGGHTRFRVRAEVENPDRRLRPGMTGVAKAHVGLRPAGALLLEPILRGLRMRWFL